MTAADRLDELARLLFELRRTAVNDDPILERACQCIEHLAAICEEVLQKQAGNDQKVPFREFI